MPIIVFHLIWFVLSTVAPGYQVSRFTVELVAYEDVFNWKRSIMATSSLCVPQAMADEANTQERDHFSRFFQ